MKHSFSCWNRVVKQTFASDEKWHIFPFKVVYFLSKKNPPKMNIKTDSNNQKDILLIYFIGLYTKICKRFYQPFFFIIALSMTGMIRGRGGRESFESKRTSNLIWNDANYFNFAIIVNHLKHSFPACIINKLKLQTFHI